jgi:hypothetical protein
MVTTDLLIYQDLNLIPQQSLVILRSLISKSRVEVSHYKNVIVPLF